MLWDRRPFYLCLSLMVKILEVMYDISRWKSLWKIWKSAPAGKNRIRTFRLFIFFVLLYSVILGLRPCWGADMRGRIVNNIFFLMFRLIRIRFFCRRKRFPASALFGFVSCQLLRSFQYNWLVCETARMQLSSWMWKKESLPDPDLVRISSLFGPAEIVFSDSDPDPHSLCVKLKLSGC